MILVTGASGKLGRHTIGQLLERVDAARVVALTRTPERLAGLGVATRTADFDDPARLVAAFDGAERLLLISTGVFDPPGRRITQHANAVDAAVKAGVGHLLYTSIACAGDPAHPASVAADHRATEETIAASGLPYTMLRNSMYTELILLGAPLAVATGVLLDNSGAGGISYVTREDCAAVAAVVLAEGGYEGERLEVTGPSAVGQAEVAALLTEFTGVPVRYVPTGDEEIITELVRFGMPEAAARRYVTIGQATRDGFTDIVTDVVERVTGRRPTSVESFLAANRAALPTG
jgi:NAD(P)H dehydrogenase (quinone)